MTDKKKKVFFYLYIALLTLVLFIIQYNGIFSLSIGGANPMLMLSLCICYSMFFGDLPSVLFALILGAITDGAAAGTTLFFNTAVFMLIAFAVSLAVSYLFNNNYRSALALGIIFGAAYYILRFIFCVNKSGLENSVAYLLRSSLPSVIYTAIVTLGLYFAVKKIFKTYQVR